MISYRPLTAEDLERLFLWLIEPHVVKGYAPAPSSFAETVAKYGPRTQSESSVKSFIVTIDGRDAGYIQWYEVAVFPEYEAALECEKGVACIDFFIGEASLLGRGLGADVARRFVDDFVFVTPRFHACIAGAADGHAASIRAFENAGFRRWKILRTEGKPPECVMRRER